MVALEDITDPCLHALDYGDSNRNSGADDFWVAYFHDALNRVTAVTERGEDPLVGYLATYSYDPLSRRTALSLGNGRSVTYAYEPDSALDVLDHRDTGGLTTASWTFDYNLANQVASKLVSDAAYIHAIPLDKGETYTANGLNQYGVIRQGGVSFNLSYDTNGSLTGDGTWVYGYDVENRLTSATGPGVAASYAYDPLGRRAGKSGTGLPEEEYLSDGVEEITDHDGAGNILRRYIHGPGVDEPVMMVSYDAATGAETGRQYYHADYAGSIIAMSDGTTGVIDDIYTYSAYGEVNDPSGNPFRYTGRRIDAETGLYYYRARYYSPVLGRFLQTDPIGYGDNMNMYAYVRNDPVNYADHTGKSATLTGAVAGCAATGPACPIGAAVGGIGGAIIEIAVYIGIGVVIAEIFDDDANEPPKTSDTQTPEAANDNHPGGTVVGSDGPIGTIGPDGKLNTPEQKTTETVMTPSPGLPGPDPDKDKEPKTIKEKIVDTIRNVVDVIEDLVD